MKAILTYHSLDSSGSAISVDPATFRRHVEWLATEGPPVLPLEELAASPPDTDAVAITFDDALASFSDVALPLLRDAGLPSTLFVVTGCVGGTNDWGGRSEKGIPTLPLMSWEALEEARDAGVELGAHTRTHPRLTTVPDGALTEEVEGSADDLESRLGVRPTSFCYPYGDRDERVLAATEAAFDRACTTELGEVRDAPPHLLPRLDMVYFRDPRRLEAFGGRGFRRYLRLRSVGRRVRSALARAGRGSSP